MTALCKTRISTASIKLYFYCFVSVFMHLLLFYQVTAPLNTSSFQKLLGKKGGLETATEVSFFPQAGARVLRSPTPGSSPVDLPAHSKVTQKQLASKVENGSTGLPTKGIGQGGSSTQYASILHAYLDSAKVFPRSLKDLGLSGVVKVRFKVTPEGRLEDIRLAESEAPKLLQQEAIKFLQKLETVPLPPSNYSSQQLQFELPLRYELNS